jgi:uncharacterized repeat protein (TIGR03803 family)
MMIARRQIPRAALFFGTLSVQITSVWAQADQPAAANAKFETLHSFDYADGGDPWGSLVQAVNGDLYGTTWAGGSNRSGTIFKITPGGALTTIYNFCSQPGCTDGAGPAAALTQATNGDLYGTTSAGGITNPSCPYGACGTIFKITPLGVFTTIYSFCSQSSCADGQTPLAGLVQAANGDLYGTTSEGGVTTGMPQGGGTIFKIGSGGTLTTVYSFCPQTGCVDGAYPSAGLIQATNGNLYGTTQLPQGTIFKISPGGVFASIHTFCSQTGCPDGELPSSGVVQGADGYFYGTTYNGGANVNANVPNGGGTIYQIAPSGQFTTIYSFCARSACTDGDLPQAGLIQASDGSLYGTTAYGGANTNTTVPYGGGTIFKITPAGALTTLYNFCAQSGCADGFSSIATLVQETFGAFYGTTLGGGAGGNNRGSIFALSTDAPPFVETRPSAGSAGESVAILGYGLKGATSVTFNGTPVTAFYDTPTVIYAKVPAGATTGKVQVVTPNGILSSNIGFQVAP